MSAEEAKDYGLIDQVISRWSRELLGRFKIP
jgi:ATP-dependent protease ClpP protease subunit